MESLNLTLRLLLFKHCTTQAARGCLCRQEPKALKIDFYWEESPHRETLTIIEALNKHGDTEQGQLAKFRTHIPIPSPYIADYVYFRNVAANRERHFHE